MLLLLLLVLFWPEPVPEEDEEEVELESCAYVDAAINANATAKMLVIFFILINFRIG